MHLLLKPCIASLLAVFAGMGMLLAGCSGDSRSIPDEFVGEYAGRITAVPGGTVGVIRATIFTSGSVIFTISTTDSPFIATGGISVSDRLTASGLRDGEQVEFIGIWTANGAGAATGTWIDRSNDTSGTWLITQAGVENPGAVGSYNGSYVLPEFIGFVTFDIAADGSVTGVATGLQIFDTPLSGSLTRDNLLVLAGTTGLGGTGEAIFFIGELNVATFTISDGIAGTSLSGGMTGTWTAVKAPPG